MKKTLFLILILIFLNNFLNTQNFYIAIKDIKVYDDWSSENKKVIGKLKEKEKCEIKNFDLGIYEIDKKYGCWLYIKSKKIEGWVFSYFLRLINNDEFDKNIIGFWTYSYYKDAVKKNNFDIVLQNEFKNNPEFEGMPEEEFLYYYNPFQIVINNSVLSYTAGMGGEILFINNIKKINKNHFIISGSDGNVAVSGAELFGNRLKELKIEIIIKNNKMKIRNLWNSDVDNLIKLKKNDVNNIFSKLDLLKKK